MKSAGKARNNGLYRHIRTSKEIIRNLLNDLLNNYRDSNVIKTCVTHFISEKKPVAAMCAGIDFLRRFYGSNLLAREIEELTAEKFCFDAENNVYYTPAFRKTNSSYTTLLGIDSMIYALKQAQTLR